MIDLPHATDRIRKFAADSYQALDNLIRETTDDTDDPRARIIVLEGESLMETFEGFLETLRTSGDE